MVVLVDQHDDLLVALVRGGEAFNQPIEQHSGRIGLRVRDFLLLQPLLQSRRERTHETLARPLLVEVRHVELNDWIRLRPVPLLLLDLESLEEFLLPLEKILERREHERLAEPARTRDEEDRVL